MKYLGAISPVNLPTSDNSGHVSICASCTKFLALSVILAVSIPILRSGSDAVFIILSIDPAKYCIGLLLDLLEV